MIEWMKTETEGLLLAPLLAGFLLRSLFLGSHDVRSHPLSEQESVRACLRRRPSVPAPAWEKSAVVIGRAPIGMDDDRENRVYLDREELTSCPSSTVSSSGLSSWLP